MAEAPDFWFPQDDNDRLRRPVVSALEDYTTWRCTNGIAFSPTGRMPLTRSQGLWA
jgi:hypothetical protein